MPEESERRADAQRNRDAVIAAAIAAHAGRGVVGILGRGHARSDIAVPIYLARLAPGATVASVGLVEVESGQGSAADYVEVREGAFDYAWFTPRFERTDPCAAMSAAGMTRAMKK